LHPLRSPQATVTRAPKITPPETVAKGNGEANAAAEDRVIKARPEAAPPQVVAKVSGDASAAPENHPSKPRPEAARPQTVAKINGETSPAPQNRAFKPRPPRSGVPLPGSAADIGAFLLAEVNAWGKAIRTVGAKADDSNPAPVP
jgi:hypothetical protein